jgi:hypothetical protein
LKPSDEFQTVIRWNETTDGPRTFVVFGVARGGTSAVAGLMRKLGIQMGDSLDNTHEDRDFIGKPNPARVAAIDDRNAKHQVWGWKDPNAANYLHVVAPKLVNPHYICVFRDSASIGIAHKRWHKREIRFALADITIQQQKNLFWLMNETAPCLLVSYEKLTSKPGEFARELAEFTGFPPSISDEEAREFLTPGSYKDVA